MDLRRLRAGEWIAALAGAALLASLFMGWYEVPVPTDQAPAASATETGWEAFAVVDLLLAAVALFAIALVPVTAAQRVPAIPLAQDALVAIAGKLAALLILILIRIAWTPGDASGAEPGAWLGFVAAGAIVAGGWIAMRDERLSTPDRVTDLTGAPDPEAPAIESLRAP